ncbi:aryl-sulfate sulfotransferase [Aquimarina pacifica]|uniref:aryl-sulfate sulfotransferase n=1 Tax=Aquimarina pacifica TaxID=1296415 RepID=UPI00046F7F7B|nr:aryl-sulfate sulfotransferase [Aquimarina pacifica]
MILFFEKILIIVFLIIFLFSCKNDDNSSVEIEGDDDMATPIPEISEDNPILGETGKIVTLNSSKINNGFILVNDVNNARVYLMNKLDAEIVHEWDLSLKLGNDVVLLDNGQLLASLKDESAFYDIGGYGGKIQLINPDSSIDWEFTHSDELKLSHHDIELLPNGNILILAWQIKSKAEAELAGYNLDNTIEILMPESLVEVNPNTNEIVWQWNSWDHLIQDHDDSKNNFGNVNENPQLIDLNYHYDDRGDFMHANGIDYDSENDLVYISVNFYSEIWVIDHSTTTKQAAGHEEGTYNKGGDLVYRFGNPTTYRNTTGERLFYNNHFPNVLAENENGAGNILVYMNGNIPDNEQSVVYELKIPQNFNLLPNQDNEPEIIWEFTDKDLYSTLVSGAVRLPNNNTLIAEGDYGYWEVTEDKEVIWKFEGDEGFYWRGYHYDYDHPGLIPLDLQFSLP